LGYDVVSISRRGKPSDESYSNPAGQSNKVLWFQGDATHKETLLELLKEQGPFDAYIHSIGLLLDAESGLGNLNKFASGSNSIPSAKSTYDEITKKTAYNIIDIIQSPIAKTREGKIPFVFISAAEAGWKFPAPVKWLQRYLIAKR
jgi:hypothetical protein